MAFLQNECVCGLATETLDIKARPLEILFSLSTLSGFIVAAWLKPCRHLDVTTWSFMPHFCPLFSFFSLPHGRTLWLIRVGTSWSILKTQHCYDFETNWGRKHPFSLALNLMAGARKNVRQKKREKENCYRSACSKAHLIAQILCVSPFKPFVFHYAPEVL